VDESQSTLPLDQVARRLDASGIPWAVFAGAAALAYGATRPLTDVDILVPAAEANQLVDLFPEGELHFAQPGILVWTLPGFDLLAGLGFVDLDAEMASRLTRHNLAGVDVSVIPPEDNILLKAVMGRGPEEGKHDWEDIEAMMSHLPALDWEYLRWRASTYRDPQRVQQILGRLEELWGMLGRGNRQERRPREASHA
jgi:hypothetical protein